MGAGERPAEEQLMKGGSKLFVFAGVGLALIAVLLFVVSMNGGGKADADDKADNEKITVVQAAKVIPAHQVITATDLIQTQVPVAEAPADAVTSTSEVIGQAYRVSLQIGQPLVRTQVETPGLRNDIEVGKRAMALPVDQVSAMSGLVQDGDYIDIVFKARVDLTRVLPANGADVTENGKFELEKPTLVPIGEDVENYPIAGDSGSTFIIRDDIGETAELELVAKMMLQDVRILRVVRPGDTYLPDGTKAAAVAEDGGGGPGQLIIEVTPEQAELVTFIQDSHQTYQVIVRAKDDHDKANTTGVTYSILASDAEWALPWPKPVVAPEEEAKAEGDS
jgi:pilus assembly protein CpaB